MRLTDARSATLDQLIEQLPRGSDRTWDRISNKLVQDPIAAEFGERIGRGELLSDDQWRAALVRSGAITIRERWPVGSPFAISLRVPSWLGAAQILVEPGSPNLCRASAGARGPQMCGVALQAEIERELYQDLGWLPVGVHELALSITVQRKRQRSGRAQQTSANPLDGYLWSGTLKARVEVVPTLEDAIPPASDLFLNRVVASTIHLSFLTSQIPKGSAVSGYLQVSLDGEAFSRLESTALSLQVEVFRASRRVETLQLHPAWNPAAARDRAMGAGRRQIIASARSSVIDSNFDSLESAADWSIRIKGTDRDVLRNWNAKTWWNGEITIPLSTARKRDLERAEQSIRSPWSWAPSPREGQARSHQKR